MANTTQNSVLGIPAVPKDASPSVQAYLRSLAEAVEKSIGIRGDPENRNPTVKELADAGILERTEFSTKFNPNDVNDQNRGYKSNKTKSKSEGGGAGTEGASGASVKVFVSKRQSSERGKIHTFSHGLGRAPDLIQFFAHCVKNETYYTAGDIVVISANSYDLNIGGGDVRFESSISNTEIKATIGKDGAAILNPNNASLSSVLIQASGKWELQVKAFIFN